MRQIIRLLLPALIPSWRFFDVVAPSPRIEFVLLETAGDCRAAFRYGLSPSIRYDNLGFRLARSL